VTTTPPSDSPAKKPVLFLPTLLQPPAPNQYVYTTYLAQYVKYNTLELQLTFDATQQSSWSFVNNNGSSGQYTTNDPLPAYGVGPSGGAVLDRFYVYFNYGDATQDDSVLNTVANAQNFTVTAKDSRQNEWAVAAITSSTAGHPPLWWVIFPTSKSPGPLTLDLSGGDAITVTFDQVWSPSPATFTHWQVFMWATYSYSDPTTGDTYQGGLYAGGLSVPFTRVIKPVATLTASVSGQPLTGPVVPGTPVTLTSGIQAVNGQAPAADIWTLTAPQLDLQSMSLANDSFVVRPQETTTYSATIKNSVLPVESDAAVVTIGVLTIGEPQLTGDVMGAEYTIGIVCPTTCAQSASISLAGSTDGSVPLSVDTQGKIVCELSSTKGTSLQVTQSGAIAGLLPLPDLASATTDTEITLRLTASSGLLSMFTDFSLTLLVPVILELGMWEQGSGFQTTVQGSWSTLHALSGQMTCQWGLHAPARTLCATNAVDTTILKFFAENPSAQLDVFGFGVVSRTVSQLSPAPPNTAPTLGDFRGTGSTDLAWLQGTSSQCGMFLFEGNKLFATPGSGQATSVGQGLLWGGVGPRADGTAQLVWFIDDGISTVQWNTTTSEWDPPVTVRGGSKGGSLGAPIWAGIGNFRGASGCDLAVLAPGPNLYIFEGDQNFDTANNGIGTTGLGVGITWGGVGRFDPTATTDQIVWFTPDSHGPASGSLSLVAWDKTTQLCVETPVRAGVLAPDFATVGDFNGDGLDELAWLVDGTLYLLDPTQQFKIIGWSGGYATPAWVGAGVIDGVTQVIWLAPSQPAGTHEIQSLKWTGGGWAIQHTRGPDIGVPVWAAPPGGAAVWGT